MKPQEQQLPPVDEETLARAALTHCTDGADALMHATLLGARGASEVFNLLAELEPDQPALLIGQADQELEHLFILGIRKWGGHLDDRGLRVFHHSLERWHARMQLLPSTDLQQLAPWLTSGGTLWIIAPHSMYWPEQLNDLAIRKDCAPPLCLWGRGDPDALICCEQPLAIVGSRGVNEYGRQIAHDMSLSACRAGHLIVSGGAFGTDAAAHWGAVQAIEGQDPRASGRTIAVFAGGLDHVGPQRNSLLFSRILHNHGALISELPASTIPKAHRFLLRNRIIAALSSNVIVAQARLRSGALNTAHWATELGRTVYAAPGNITSPSNAGCNALIDSQQAVMLCSLSQITQICHPSHQSLSATGAQTGDDEGILQPDEASRSSDSIPADQHAALTSAIASVLKSTKGASIQEFVAQVLCKQRGQEPARQQGHQHAAQHHDSVNGSSTDHDPSSGYGNGTDARIATIMEALASAELSGGITIVNGRIIPAIGSDQDPRANHPRRHSHDRLVAERTPLPRPPAVGAADQARRRQIREPTTRLETPLDGMESPPVPD